MSFHGAANMFAKQATQGVSPRPGKLKDMPVNDQYIDAEDNELHENRELVTAAQKGDLAYDVAWQSLSLHWLPSNTCSAPLPSPSPSPRLALTPALDL